MPGRSDVGSGDVELAWTHTESISRGTLCECKPASGHSTNPLLRGTCSTCASRRTLFNHARIATMSRS
eukprot:scaffold285375_cov31-Tisochrysis_lutea.AAC.1